MTGDRRLVAPAALCWLAVVLLVARSSTTALVVALTCITSAGVLWGRGLVLSRSGAVARTLLLSMLCLGAVATSCAWRLAGVESSPLTELAEQRRIVTAEVKVVLDARSFSRFGSTSSVAGVVVRRVQEGDGRPMAVSDRATVFFDEPADDLVTGRRVVVRGRLAPSDAVGEAATLDALERGRTLEASWWWEGSEHLRQAIRDAVSHMGPAEAALVPALVAGDDAALPEEVEEDFRRTGLTHLLAVSGTNLTIVLAVVLALARAARAPPRVLLLVGVVGVVGFVLLARPEPSVLRAAGMGLVGLAAVGYGGRGGLRALAVAVMALLFLDPWLSTTVGFILSVCATAGILIIAPPMTARLRSWLPHWVAVAIAVPFAAQLACTPAIAAISHEVSLVAVAANLLAGPVVAPATVFGLFGGLVDLVWPFGGRLLGTVAGLSSTWIVGVARWSASLDGAAVPWTAHWWVLVPLVPVVGWLTWRWAHRPVVMVGLVLGLAVALWRPPQPGWPPPGWLVAACDVGQGDATVLRIDDRSALLVDAGPDGTAVDRCLRGLGVRELAGVVLTHAHADHFGGFGAAVEGRGEPTVLVGVSAVETPGHEQRTLATGDSLRAGPWSLQVLWPPPGDAVPPDAGSQDAGPEDSGANDASLTLLAEAQGVSFLLTGDLEPAGQEALLREVGEVGADVLKMPHHGSSRQSERFFAAVAPQVVTISAGRDNEYGHPSGAALDLLREVGARWWRTDLDGDLAVVVRDGRLSVATRGGSER
ncbi:DNA internalization-related competence protein ComEC/Rec2 [Aeromicrobium sp. CTD01-1L150]|uniref:DNA internalization-related competence protein ComEC/Rec2 n=1 Tax=Aeromicrobium sp. CTD01-1L150 TaxID=3341830 RepID=UPI0035BED075